MNEQIVVSGEKKKIKHFVLCLGFCNVYEWVLTDTFFEIRHHDLWWISYEEWWLVQAIHNNNG